MRGWVLWFFKNLGFLTSITGQVCSLMTLCFPRWLTFSTLHENEKCMLGLWETFVTQDLGGTLCRSSTSLWNLATEMLMARILVCIACISGAFGLVAVLLGLSCKKYGGRQGSSVDRITNVSGGALFFVAGVTMLVPMSYIRHITEQMSRGPEPSSTVIWWEYSTAVFFGWVGGLFLVIGGLLLLVSQLYDNILGESFNFFSFRSNLFKKRGFV